jgi:hypothetical protein
VAEATLDLAHELLRGDRLEEALPLLIELEAKWADKTLRGGEALLLRGAAEMALLHHGEAMAALTRFLKDYPEAPPGMRSAASRQLEQLRRFHAGKQSDVHLRMEYSRRKLAAADTGDTTRQEQTKIVALLGELIEEAQAREASAANSAAGQGGKPGQPGESPSEAKGEKGQGEKGQGEKGQSGNQPGGSRRADAEPFERLTRGGPPSAWSKLRPREREAVYSAIKEKFPGRYQQLIEQYYKSFQEDDEE